MVSKKASVTAPKIDVEKSQAENPNSRFRVLNLAILPPGTCFVCGSAGGPERQFVDFGKGIDFFGAIYVCTLCVTEMATLLGFAISADLVKEVEILQIGCVSRDLEIEELKEKFNAARLLLRNCHCSDSDSVSNDSVDVSSTVEDSGEAESDGREDGESSSIEGFDDVSASSDDADESESRD